MTITTSNLKPYSAYKDSGVEWLGEIPAHWGVKRLKSFATVQISNVDKKSSEGQDAVRLSNYVDVYYNERIDGGLDFMAATATPEQIRRFSLRAGDVLITKDSETWTDIGVPALVSEDIPGVLCGYHLAHIRSNGHCDGGFLSRVFSAVGPRDQYHVAANGITRFGLTGDSIRTGVFPLPSLVEQTAIAAFLDRETAKIDALVGKKKRLIELLREKRTALISHAVTKGLDPAAPLKDSGVEWLGEIPAHWEVKRLGRIGRFFKGRGGTKADERDTGVPCIRYGDLYTKHHFLITASRAYVTPELAMSVYTPINYGDVLFAGSGETIDDIGKSAVNLIREQVCCGGDVIVYRPSVKMDAPFLGYATDCPASTQQKAYMGRGYTVMHIYSGELKYLAVPLPPLSEQTAIAAFLDRETAKIDALVTKVEEAIDRLQEYRTALISAAVTGKIDVR